MGANLVVAEGLIARLPLPLAQQYRRAHDYRLAPSERCYAAYYVWEAGLKLLASTAIVHYAAGQAVDETANSYLRFLARPAIGHWWGFVKLLLPLVARQGHADARAVVQLLFDKQKRNDLPMCAGLLGALNAWPEKPTQAATIVSISELFDRLVWFRNKEIGHGAAGQRKPEDYRRLAPVLLAGLEELFHRLDPLLGGRALFTARVEDVGGRTEVQWLELAGDVPRQLPDDAVVRLSGTILGQRVYLERERPPERHLLYPLMDFSPETGEFFFLDSPDDNSKADYLCYATGRAERKELSEERRKLLADILRVRSVDAQQMADWAEKAKIDEPRRPEPESGHSALGEFELISELGEGRMGTVYRAWQPSLGRQVALKELRRYTESDKVRFGREITALSRVKHSHLAQIYSQGIDGRRWFLVMELIEGAPLSQVFHSLRDSSGGHSEHVNLRTWQETVSTVCEQSRREEKPISSPPPQGRDGRRERGTAIPVEDRPGVLEPNQPDYARQAAELVRQVANATHALHQGGYIHRDIKPGNVMIDPSGKRAVLVDLGLAKVLEERAADTAGTTQFVGTPRYASPQQAQDPGKPDTRNDVYSLGATLWELLALQPFLGIDDSWNAQRALLHIQSAAPEPVLNYNRRVSPDLAAIVDKCVERDPARRYTTARDLADDLSRFLNGEPVQARPLTRFDRAVKWVRRKPKEAAMYALMLLALFLILVGGGMTWLWRDAMLAKRQAIKARDSAQEAEKNEIQAKTDLQKEKVRSESALNEKLKFETQARQAGENELKAKLALLDLTEREASAARYRASQFEYVNSTRSIQVSVDNGSVIAAEQELRRLEAKAADRQWEGQVLAEQLPSDLRGHQGLVFSVGFSSDSRLLATGSADSTIRVWDVATRRELNVLKGGHRGCVHDLSFSPDGRHLASCSCDGSVLLWNLETGKHEFLFVRPPEELPAPPSIDTKTDKALPIRTTSFFSLCFSPDGNHLATGSTDGVLRIWDVKTKKPKELKHPRNVYVWSVSISPDGRKVATGATDGLVRIWNVENLDCCELKGHTSYVWSVAFSPDGRNLASGSSDGTVRLWDVATGNNRVIEKLTVPVWCVCFSPDGRRLARGSSDRTVLVRDLITDDVAALIACPDIINSVRFSPNGLYLATAFGRWSEAAAAAAEIYPKEKPELGAPPDIGDIWMYKGKPRNAANRAIDSGAWIWNIASYDKPALLSDTPIHRMLPGAPKKMPAPQKMPTIGKRQAVPELISARSDPVLATRPAPWSFVSFKLNIPWNTAEPAPAPAAPFRSPPPGTESVVVFSPDGRTLAAAASALRLWDLASFAEPRILPSGPLVPLYSSSFDAAGKQIACGDVVGTVAVWDLSHGGSEPRILRNSSQHPGVATVAFAPNGRYLAVGTIINAPPVMLPEPPVKPRGEALPERGKLNPFFVSQPQRKRPEGKPEPQEKKPEAPPVKMPEPPPTGNLRIWNLTAKDEKDVRTVYVGNISSLCYSPDGKLLASGSSDPLDPFIRIWNTSTWKEEYQLRGHSNGISSVVFSPDGQSLASASSDKTVRLWDLKTRREALVIQTGDSIVTSLCFSPDGKRLASGSSDDKVRVWNVITGSEPIILPSSVGSSVNFSPDGRRLASGSRDGLVRVWEIDCQHFWRLRQATDAERN
jgi:WD40 repeat protein/serine/threonine protein kinase